MFDFAHPYYLFMLLAVPVIWFMYWLSQRSRRHKIRKFGNPQVLAQLMPDASHYKPALKITFQMLALVAIVIIIAQPRYGEKEKVESRSGIEVMIAFDVSKSMLASSTNDPNATSRLRRAKLLLEKLVDKLKDDKVGLVMFAGNAKTKLPLTTDFYSAKLILNDLDPSMMPYQGTSIGEAIGLSMNSFTKEENVHRAIILITDAEDHEGDAIKAAEAAAQRGIQVDVIGVGTSTGAKIPENGSYLKDNEGNDVVTKVDEKSAQLIAKAGKGIYVNGASNDALDKLVEALDKLGKSEFENVSYTVAAEQFPLFAWIALVFLMIDIFIVERKIGWLKDVNFFTKKNPEPSSSPRPRQRQ